MVSRKISILYLIIIVILPQSASIRMPMQRLFTVLLAMPLMSGLLLAGTTTDFTPHGTQPGLTHDLLGPSNCKSCHAGFVGSQDYVNDKTFLPYPTWAGSMKANATRDPLFWAALDVANNDMPGVGDFCLRCHTPQGWYAGHVVKPVDVGQPLVDGANGCELMGDHVAFSDANNDYTGVTCHFCHRVEEVGPMNEPHPIGNNQVWLDDEECAVPGSGFGPCRKGPYKYDSNSTVGAPPHKWEYSTFIQSSEVCGSCHDVTSPEIEQNGVLSYAQLLWDDGKQTNIGMPIERTYSEWKNSRFADLIFKDDLEDSVGVELPVLATGKTCQNCHMPDTDNMAARACANESVGSREGDLAVHQFAGGNSWMPQVIKNIYGDDLEMVDQGIKELLDLTTTYAENMLQLHSALIDVSLVSLNATEMVVDVKVTNLTGHKLPTGYPEGRRMWLNVVATDDNSTEVFESGAYDALTAVLTEDAQAKVYEAQPGIWNEVTGTCEVKDGKNQKMFHFVKNNCILKDNRIPPLGFRGGDDLELKPRGIAYPNHPNNGNELVNYDITRYTIPVSGATFPVSVQATLKYQTASKEYIDFLDNEATDHSIPTENLMCDRSWTVGPGDQSRGAFMKQVWQNNGQSAPVDMVMDIETFNLP